MITCGHFPDNNGKWIAFKKHHYPKHFTVLPHIHADGGVNHATCQEELGLGGVLLRDTLTLS